jgi:hypothetical protein
MAVIFAGCAALSMPSGGSEGNPAKKDVIKKTFEAVMCMKTKEDMTHCPEKSRTFMYFIRTFLSNRHELCRNSGRIYDKVTASFDHLDTG